MEEIFDIIVSKNCRTGKKEIYKITKFENLSKKEANEKIEELLSKHSNKIVLENGSIELFLNENNEFDNTPVGIVYQNYIDFCKKINMKSENKIVFGKYISQNTNYKNILVHRKGKTTRMYIKNIE